MGEIATASKLRHAHLHKTLACDRIVPPKANAKDANRLRTPQTHVTDVVVLNVFVIVFVIVVVESCVHRPGVCVCV